MSALFRLYHSEGGEWVMRLVEDTSLQQILHLHWICRCMWYYSLIPLTFSNMLLITQLRWVVRYMYTLLVNIMRAVSPPPSLFYPLPYLQTSHAAIMYLL